ncbi:MAG: hypothetical protein ACTSQU_14390, partial [Promethearchaeota archaeon]
AIVSPVKAANPNRILMVDFMAKGDDLDIPRTTNSIIGKFKYDKVSGVPSVQVNFHSKIYDESGEKVYAMKGMLKDGGLVTTDFTFYCPIFEVWFIHVWQVMGVGKFKTTDTDYSPPGFYRNFFPITMPNTGGKYVSAQIFMLLNPTGEYRNGDPITGPIGPVKIWEEGGWVLAAVIWNVGIPEIEAGFGPGMFPVGPLSYLTKFVEK